MLIAAVKDTLLTLSLAMVAALASACGGGNVASELEHLRTVIPSLAEFYFNEVRQHAVDATLLAAVRVSLLKKDAAGFDASYRAALDGCYSCHKASSKPFLRPVVPTAPAQTLIDFTPEAALGR